MIGSLRSELTDITSLFCNKYFYTFLWWVQNSENYEILIIIL